MKKIVILLCVYAIPLIAYSQNEFEIKKSIESSLAEFFSHLSQLNDNEEPIQPSTIASHYCGEHYFIANGKETTLVAFLTAYRSTLGNNYINHTVNIPRGNIKKTSTAATDRRWTVKAILSRSSATDEDSYIRDEDVTLVVQWNGLEKDVSILDITFSTPLQKVYPQVRREYRFEIDKYKSNLLVPSEGGEWTISVISSYRDVKYYPGFPDKDVVGRDFPAKFTYSASRDLGVKVMESSNTMKGLLRGNFNKHNRQYTITLSQEGNTKNLQVPINQEGRGFNFFDFDKKYSDYYQFDVLYSLKYNFGLSGLYTFENSRFSIGALIALNFDTFRAMEDLALVSQSYHFESITGGNTSDVTNGYKKNVHTDTPSSTSYSEMMDPYNEAKHYTKRMLYLLQGGFAVNQWLSIHLGLGAASARNLHFMQIAYTRTVYSFEKQDASLPDIPDEVVYTHTFKDYYYKDATKWGFAIRPALNFHIPLNEDFDLALGAGYTFVTHLKDANSFDFSVGIRWVY